MELFEGKIESAVGWASSSPLDCLQSIVEPPSISLSERQTPMEPTRVDQVYWNLEDNRHGGN